MKMKVVVVGDEDMALGFSLAGVDKTYVPSDDYDARKQLNHLLEEPDVGIILLSERIAEDIREHLQEKIKRKKELYPIIVEIPNKEGKLKDKEDPLKGKIRRAVGIDITSTEEE
ncbi:MAG: V-type ATP synthase subunit F [Thermoplasmatota archaeon]